MKNNKGMTLVEIIISIALISIVLLFLFILLVTVNDINTESEVNSTYLINKSLILKNIEEELSKANSISLSSCNINDFYTGYEAYKNTLETKNKTTRCISLKYLDNVGNQIGTPAYIAIYYYKNKTEYVISYIHDSIKATRLLPDFEEIPFNISASNDFILKLGESTCGSNLSGCSNVNNSFSTITIPLIGPDEKDYSIIISYYGTVTIDTTI